MFRNMPSNIQKSVRASEVAKNFGEWHDVALSEPVYVTRYGRVSVVLVSADRYRHLTQTAQPVSERPRSGSVPLFTPHQILAAYAQGKVEWEIAASRLGLDSYRELVIALADVGLDLPGTDERTLTEQVQGSVDFLLPFLKEEGDA